MTDDKWLSATDPEPMLEFLHGAGKASERKLLLFAVACCRRIWHLMTDERSRRLVEVVERLIERESSEEEWRDASLHARQAWIEGGRQYGPVFDRRLAGEARSEEDGTIHARHFSNGTAWELRHLPSTTPNTSVTPGWEGFPVAFSASRWAATAVHDVFLTSPEEARVRQQPVPCSQAVDLDYHNSPERLSQCEILRDLFGRLPFRPVVFDRSCLTPVVLALAQAIYEERSFERTRELADALAAAGCTDAEILAHLRSPGPHVRGCWALDLIAGRT